MTERRTLTHVDARGQARMVDVSAKDVTVRTASARGRVLLGVEAVAALGAGRYPRATRSPSRASPVCRRPSAPPTWCRSRTR
jgi:hypothetical protein